MTLSKKSTVVFCLTALFAFSAFGNGKAFILPLGEYKDYGKYVRWEPPSSLINKIDTSLRAYMLNLESGDTTAADTTPTDSSRRAAYFRKMHEQAVDFVKTHYADYNRQYLGCFSEGKYIPECDSTLQIYGTLPKPEIKGHECDYGKNICGRSWGGSADWEIKYDAKKNLFFDLDINESTE